MKASLLNGFIMAGILVFIIEIIRRYKKKSPQKSLKGRLNNIVDSIRDSYLDDETTDTDFVFKCKTCSQVLQRQPGSDGRTVGGSWKCPNGCKIDNDKTILKGNNFIRYIEIFLIIALVVFLIYFFLEQLFVEDILWIPIF